jgi:hypothetical protein
MKRIYAFYLFLGIALATQGQAEEYYTYRDPDRKLVISNKPPPAGSKIIKQQNLPEVPASQIQDTKENEDVPLKGNSKAAAKPSTKK